MSDQRIDEAHDVGPMARFRQLAAARERLAGDPPTPKHARAAIQPSLLAERRYRKAFYDVLFEGTVFASYSVKRAAVDPES
ncbi:hypothetical protein [Paludisphaera rhizosphaerae]|uniref:hypothetical protein n=1 Tax=Paludisphaera rhizosphaerae TaxID=2711216 RepID=UPI0013E9F0C2|nr:hypothetical protein [Paludisphaera rhizosphaerae]